MSEVADSGSATAVPIITSAVPRVPRPTTHRTTVIPRPSTDASRSASIGRTRPARHDDTHTPLSATSSPVAKATTSGTREVLSAR